MTPLHWILTAAAALILATLAGLLAYDVVAMLRGWRSLSVILSRIHRAWVFVVGLAWGLTLGFICGHLWPITGNP